VHERFISLTALVRGAPAPAASTSVASVPAPSAPRAVDFAQAGVVHELALMRLAAMEAFEGLAHRALRLLASDVLFRELALAPADVEALAKRALERFAEHAPVAIAISEADAERVRLPIPVRVDPALCAGDLVVDVRDGAFESHFSFRLEDALLRAEASA
jgi:hypothetical protein